jgi:hypothetical protein
LGVFGQTPADQAKFLSWTPLLGLIFFYGKKKGGIIGTILITF